MSRHHLRKDPVCQNCGHLVEQRYCSSCGQENVETRQSFGHLVRHFIEDITHYDGSFWRTLKYLMFRPAYVTKEFLAGKRASFLPPVRLYIFASFLAFFIPYILPDFEDAGHQSAHTAQEETVHADSNALPHPPVADVPGLAPDSSYHAASGEENTVGDPSAGDTVQSSDHAPAHLVHRDSIAADTSGDRRYRFGIVEGKFYTNVPYRSVHEFDSINNTLPLDKRRTGMRYWFIKKMLVLNGQGAKEMKDKFLESFKHNFPKTLFVYLPLFALTIWLFHNKKRWLYFDHAIFTLHYFSFVLLGFTFLSFFDAFIAIPLFFGSESLADDVSIFTNVLAYVGMMVYFFKAHRNMFGEKKRVSVFKSVLILFVNSFVFFALMVGFSIITMLSLH